ncbi:MAG: TetR family transcriptional regulator, partial [Rubrivivax sp.]
MSLHAAVVAKPARRAAAAGTAPRRDRRQAILLAAEKLFAQHGYHAVTIRQIAEEAAVPLALVGYYFGPKHELFHAIFEHWRHTVDERVTQLRQPRDAGVSADVGAAAVRRIVEAFVQPVLRMRASGEGEFYALLVARELAFRAPETDRVLADFFDPMAHAFIDALHAACPASSRPLAAWAYQFALGALMHHISDFRVLGLSRGRNKLADPAAGAMLVDFISAGIGAVLLPPPLPKPLSTPSRNPTPPRSRRWYGRL